MQQTLTAPVPKKPASASKRFTEFDVLRAISMMLMVMSHVWEQFYAYITPEVCAANSWFAYLYPIIGPSVLMMCLGTNLSFSRNAKPELLIRRGLVFICIDFVLNLLRFGVPVIMLALFGRSEYLSFLVSNILCSDIYAFVGAFFILYGLFKKWKLSSLALLCIAVLMLSINTVMDLLHLNQISNHLLADFLGRFFWIGESSYFSLFPWMIFPVVGCCFGDYYKNLTDDRRDSLARQLLQCCSVGLIVFSVALLANGVSPRIAVITLNEYKIDMLNVILMILLGGLVFSLAHMFVARKPETSFIKLCVKVSRVIMPFYVTQWIIVAWIQFTLEGLQAYGLFKSSLAVYLTSFALIAISLFLSFAFEKLKAKRRKKG